MFEHAYPGTNLSEMNLDYILAQIEKFRSELESLEDKVYERVMEQVQPQITELVTEFNTLSGSFEVFKTEVRASQAAFEQQINDEIAAIERDFQNTKDQLNALVEQAKLYSDIQNDNLYNKIVDDINNGVIGIGDVKVINYITGETMTVQQMFDYLCMFHLTNPITYTQLALKSITYSALAALNLTYTDIIVNGNVLIP